MKGRLRSQHVARLLPTAAEYLQVLINSQRAIRKKETSAALLNMWCKKKSSNIQFCNIHAEEKIVINSWMLQSWEKNETTSGWTTKYLCIKATDARIQPVYRALPDKD